MATLPIFGEVLKTVKDHLTKEFPGDKSKVELTSNASNGTTFVSSLTRSFDNGSYVGLFNPKYKNVEWGLNASGSVDTKGEIKAEASYAADSLLEGLKGTLLGQTGGDPKNAPVKATVELKHGPNFTGTASLDLFHPTNGTTLTVGLVAGYEGFIGGLQPEIVIEKQELTTLNGALGYRAKDFEAFISGERKGEDLTAKGSYFHTLSSSFKVGGEVEVNVHKLKEEKPKFSFGGAYKFDASSSAKLKVNSDALVNWSYTQQFNPSVKLTFGGAVDAKQLKEGVNHKFGLELLINA
jgi:hypothetical protein